MSKSIFLGYQVTASFEGCILETISDSEQLLLLLRRIVKLMGYDEVSYITHSFTPHGITCVLILAQSHLIAHTWPEYHALVIDLFVCGNVDFRATSDLIKNILGAKSVVIETRSREIQSI